MKNRHIALWALSLMISSATMAQEAKDAVVPDSLQNTIEEPDTLSGVMKDYMILKLKPENEGFRLDTVSILYEKLWGVLDYLNDPSTPERYIASNPGCYRLFLPLTFYNSPMNRLSKLEWKEEDAASAATEAQKLLPFDTLRFTSIERTGKLVDKALLSTYVNYPDLMRIVY